MREYTISQSTILSLSVKKGSGDHKSVTSNKCKKIAFLILQSIKNDVGHVKFARVLQRSLGGSNIFY